MLPPHHPLPLMPGCSGKVWPRTHVLHILMYTVGVHRVQNWYALLDQAVERSLRKPKVLHMLYAVLHVYVVHRFAVCVSCMLYVYVCVVCGMW
jgi:hypothetical protein